MKSARNAMKATNIELLLLVACMLLLAPSVTRAYPGSTPPTKGIHRRESTEMDVHLVKSVTSSDLQLPNLASIKRPFDIAQPEAVPVEYNVKHRRGTEVCKGNPDLTGVGVSFHRRARAGLPPGL